MLGRNMHPEVAIELSIEARIREQQKELSDLADDELKILMKDGRKKWIKSEGDPACNWMNNAYQPNEVYRGLAAGRILVERHDENYVKNLLKRDKMEEEIPNLEETTTIEEEKLDRKPNLNRKAQIAFYTLSLGSLVGGIGAMYGGMVSENEILEGSGYGAVFAGFTHIIYRGLSRLSRYLQRKQIKKETKEKESNKI